MRRIEKRLLHSDGGTSATENTRSTRELTAEDPRIQRALEILKQMNAIKSAEIADRLHLSASRFRHIFSKEMGISPRQYLKLARLERAKELFEKSFLRVKEIAALVGVNDVSHFVRDYKTLYRQTPSQTRMLSARSTPPSHYRQ